MGWVGWTEEQTLATNMQAIVAAYYGCHERLCAVAGRQIAYAEVVAVPTKTLTPDLFDKLFGA